MSFLKPGDDDGHPGYSTLAAFETFVSKAVNAVRNQQSLWTSTAIVVTMDESGGYYDSGYIQPISFFGDGPRVPLIVVSPYTKTGYVDHTYNDHVSIIKFIEKNWHLGKLSARSWDNLPNPTSSTNGGYLPGNRAAIGDLMTLFDFSAARAGAALAPVGAGIQAGVSAAPGAEVRRLRD
jgi:phospholipase C